MKGGRGVWARYNITFGNKTNIFEISKWKEKHIFKKPEKREKNKRGGRGETEHIKLKI